METTAYTTDIILNETVNVPHGIKVNQKTILPSGSLLVNVTVEIPSTIPWLYPATLDFEKYRCERRIVAQWGDWSLESTDCGIAYVRYAGVLLTKNQAYIGSVNQDRQILAGKFEAEDLWMHLSDEAKIGFALYVFTSGGKK